MGLTGPVWMLALRAAQAELSPAGVVKRQDEFPPGAAHLAAAAQVREREVGQNNPPQLHGEVAHLHGSGDAGPGEPGNSHKHAHLKQQDGARASRYTITNMTPLRLRQIQRSWSTRVYLQRQTVCKSFKTINCS